MTHQLRELALKATPPVMRKYHDGMYFRYAQGGEDIAYDRELSSDEEAQIQAYYDSKHVIDPEFTKAANPKAILELLDRIDADEGFKLTQQAILNDLEAKIEAQEKLIGELVKHNPPRRWSFGAHKAWDDLKAAYEKMKEGGR